MADRNKDFGAHGPMAARALIIALIMVLSPAWASALDKVTVRLQWVHQAQFAGFYVAHDHGIYRKFGLEVKILPGGTNIDPLAELIAGRCDFTSAWLSEAVRLRSKGAGLVLLAQVVQRSALLLVTFKKSGVTRVKDLAGRRVGLWRRQFSLAPRALFRRLGIKVIEIGQGVTMAPFLSRAVAAATAMLYNEYHQLYQAGVNFDELRVFHFAELGLNFPEDGVYTMKSTWRKRPDVCRRFVAATLAGWRRAFKRPVEALGSVMLRVNAARLAYNLSHQRWMLRTMKDLITHRVGLKLMGQLSMKDLGLVNRVLLSQKIISAPVAAKGFVVPAWRKQ